MWGGRRREEPSCQHLRNSRNWQKPLWPGSRGLWGGRWGLRPGGSAGPQLTGSGSADCRIGSLRKRNWGSPRGRMRHDQVWVLKTPIRQVCKEQRGMKQERIEISWELLQRLEILVVQARDCQYYSQPRKICLL